MCAVSFSDFSEKSEKTSQHAATLPLVTKDFPNKMGNMHRRVHVIDTCVDASP